MGRDHTRRRMRGSPMEGELKRGFGTTASFPVQMCGVLLQGLSVLDWIGGHNACTYSKYGFERSCMKNAQRNATENHISEQHPCKTEQNISYQLDLVPMISAWLFKGRPFQ